MSPSILNNNKADDVSADSDFDLQKWLKEIEGAENLMSEVEAKADSLQAKVDALLLEVGQPPIQLQETIEVKEEEQEVVQEKPEEREEETKKV